MMQTITKSERVVEVSRRENDDYPGIFPNAEIIRSEMNSHQSHYMELYLKHKLAEIFIPDNIIQVSGALHPDSYTHLLFSREAQVPPAHHTFGRHLAILEGFKYSVDNCPECISHREFHISNTLKQKADQISVQAYEYGFILPANDPSDYCLDASGNIRFFEIDGYIPNSTISFLENQPQPLTDLQLRALRLAVTYQYYQSKVPQVLKRLN